LISGSEKGIKTFILFLLLMCAVLLPGQSVKNPIVEDIAIWLNGKPLPPRINPYEALLDLKWGEPFSFKKVRSSMENLYKTGSFDDIRVSMEERPENRRLLIFDLFTRFTVHTIKVKEEPAIDDGSCISAIYSLRKNTYFEEENLPAARQEIRSFLESRGYFNSRIDYTLEKNREEARVDVLFRVKAGPRAIIDQVIWRVSVPEMQEKLTPLLDAGEEYRPDKLQYNLEKIKKRLKKEQYYYPEINFKPLFRDKERTHLDLEVIIEPGYRYIFAFQGMEKRLGLISSLWEQKRFEKWAEKESQARLLFFLRQNGYIDAQVDSRIEIKGNSKYITFSVNKNARRKLGKIDFSGNRAIVDQRLSSVIQTDDQMFAKLFWLRVNSLIIDLGVLRQYYHFSGFPLAQVAMNLLPRGKRVDVEFIINEGQKYTVESILFAGHQFLNAQQLHGIMRTRENGPFVQEVLNRDLENIENLYSSHGFDQPKIKSDVSAGAQKSILITIEEGQSYRMGKLIILGASSGQRKLLGKLFPLEANVPFNPDSVEAFRTEIENSAVFSEIKISPMKKETGTVDVLVKVTPDRGKYYGLGIGWEDRKGARATVEYQGKNIFNTISSLSAMLQIGLNERRGLISYDTPYLLKNKINSSFKIWADNEVYPSYQLNRYGLGESIIRGLSPDSYMLASLSWYRTELTDLKISARGVDRLGVPFDTTALNLSYVRERRNDPFNPSKGDFFSSDIKIGFPLFEKDYSFIRFLWSYQNNYRFLRYGTLMFSVRNGFASGDMSITERFFAGGVHTFRGTGNDRLSPIDSLTNEPRGGNAMILFNLEASFPLVLVPVKDLYYSIFFDTGNVFEKVTDFDLSKLERAIGFSLKFKTQMGPLRLDFGWNLKKRPGGSFEWNFGIGNVF